METTQTEGIKQNLCGKIIEDTKTIKFGESPCRYHALTRDLVSNEIFRRVHSSQKTMGEAWREDWNAEFGTSIRVGINDEEYKEFRM